MADDECVERLKTWALELGCPLNVLPDKFALKR